MSVKVLSDKGYYRTEMETAILIVSIYSVYTYLLFCFTQLRCLVLLIEKQETLKFYYFMQLNEFNHSQYCLDYDK